MHVICLLLTLIGPEAQSGNVGIVGNGGKFIGWMVKIGLGDVGLRSLAHQMAGAGINAALAVPFMY